MPGFSALLTRAAPRSYKMSLISSPHRIRHMYSPNGIDNTITLQIYQEAHQLKVLIKEEFAERAILLSQLDGIGYITRETAILRYVLKTAVDTGYTDP